MPNMRVLTEVPSNAHMLLDSHGDEMEDTLILDLDDDHMLHFPSSCAPNGNDPWLLHTHCTLEIILKNYKIFFK